MNRLDQLLKEKEKIESEIDLISKLKDRFPDLTTHTDRWKNVKYMSVKANSEVDNVHTYHSCGCCNDAAYLASPFLTVNGVRIHSNPCEFYLGDKSYDGHNFTSNSTFEMEKHNINQIVIDKVKKIIENEKESLEE